MSLIVVADSAGEAKDPALIEPDSVDGVLYPLDGLYVWPASVLARFKGKVHFPYTVAGDPRAAVFDLEPGCCSVAEVASGIEVRRKLGAASIVYCSIANWQTYYDQLDQLLTTGPVSYWWVADYRSPDRPGVLPALSKRYRAVGLQWYDFGSYDLSMVDHAALPPNLAY
jgi:hypothetical protein